MNSNYKYDQWVYILIENPDFRDYYYGINTPMWVRDKIGRQWNITGRIGIEYMKALYMIYRL